MFLRILCVLVLLPPPTADGYKHLTWQRCLYRSDDPKDVEYIRSYVHNKEEFLRYNSTEGKYKGFNEFGIKNAEEWNKNEDYIRNAQLHTELCKSNGELYQTAIWGKTVKPWVALHSDTPLADTHTVRLRCSAYDFYPQQITVRWLRNGQEVTSGVMYSEVHADGDWYYQYHAHLEFTPTSSDRMSCMVEHSSLEKPLVQDWDPSMPESDRNKMALGAAALVLGAVLALIGFLFYRKKSRRLL